MGIKLRCGGSTVKKEATESDLISLQTLGKGDSFLDSKTAVA
jgi:hypothetical protein